MTLEQERHPSPTDDGPPRATVRPSPWSALIALPVLVVTLGVYALIITSDPDAAPAYLWLPVLGLAITAVIGSMRGEICMTGETLRLRAFPFWTFTIPVNRIQAVEVTSVDAFADFLGIGLRIGQGGAVGIIMRSGPALAITADSAKRYIMVLPEPEKWQERILESRAADI
ncbi:hypothetical protein GCM10009799_26440 [Nocardiopsis rhodophaea]|uniref:PH domain-containing protein n=1 Tax=Nocardiopsis rhodophaea TaxID=280238 RepID=A0ABP5EIQ7_9ACTN